VFYFSRANDVSPHGETRNAQLDISAGLPDFHTRSLSDLRAVKWEQDDLASKDWQGNNNIDDDKVDHLADCRANAALLFAGATEIVRSAGVSPGADERNGPFRDCDHVM